MREGQTQPKLMLLNEMLIRARFPVFCLCGDKFLPLTSPPQNLFFGWKLGGGFSGDAQHCSVSAWSCDLAMWAVPKPLENARVTLVYLPKFADKSSPIYPLICSLRSVLCKRTTPRRCMPWNTWINKSAWSVMKWEMFSRSYRLCRAWSTPS